MQAAAPGRERAACTERHRESDCQSVFGEVTPLKISSLGMALGVIQITPNLCLPD